MSDQNMPTPSDEAQRESGVNISGESQVTAKNVIGGDYVVHGSVYNVGGNLTINQGKTSSPSAPP